MAEIEKLLPENPPFFDPDIYTDKSPRFLAAEIIREKAFRLLGDELPYGIAVTIDSGLKTISGQKLLQRSSLSVKLIREL